MTLEAADALLDELRATPAPTELLEVEPVPSCNVVYRHREAGEPLTDLSDYRARGRLRGPAQGASTEMDRDEAALRVPPLRACAAAAAPASRWAARPASSPRTSALPAYVVCNADESEPGTFKDRELIEDNPFQLLEGITLAGYAIGAARGYIYIRGEYEHQARVLDAALRPGPGGRLPRARASWAPASTSTSRSTAAPAPTSAARRPALLESLEGKRGQPRLKPPFPAVAGPLRLAHPDQQRRDPRRAAARSWSAAPTGTPRSAPRRARAPRSSRVSGHVERPGNYEIVMDETTLRELVYDLAGGLPPGPRLQGRWVGRLERQRAGRGGPRHPARLRVAGRGRHLAWAAPAAS